MMQNHKLIKIFALMLALILTTGIIGPSSMDIFSLTVYADDDTSLVGDASFGDDAQAKRLHEGQKDLSKDVDYFNTTVADTTFANQIKMATNYASRMAGANIYIGADDYSALINVSNIAPFFGYTDGEINTDLTYSPQGGTEKNSASSVAYSRVKLLGYQKGNNDMYKKWLGDQSKMQIYDYANYGLLLNIMGFDNVGAEDVEAERNLFGHVAYLAYTAASSVNMLFEFAYKALTDLNPFQFFTKADTITRQDALAGTTGSYSETTVVEHLITFFSGIYDVFVNFAWAVSIPLSILFIIIAFFLTRNGRAGFGKNIKKLFIRIIFLVVGIPILGSAYTQVLEALSTSNVIADEYVTQAISYTFLDFEAWVKAKRLDPSAAKGLSASPYPLMIYPGISTTASTTGTGDRIESTSATGDAVINGYTWMELKALCSSINEANGVFKFDKKYLAVNKNTGALLRNYAEMGDDIDAQAYGGLSESHLSDDLASTGGLSSSTIDEHQSVKSLLTRYMSGAKYDAVTFKDGAMESIQKIPNFGDMLALSSDKYSFSSQSTLAVRNLQGNTTTTYEYYDPTGKNSQTYGQVAKDRFNGFKDGWKENGWNNGTLTSDYSGGAGTIQAGYITYGSDIAGDYTGTAGLSVISKCGLSTMAMFTYLTTKFTQEGMIVYGGAPSVYTQNAHYSVNLIGGNYVMRFAFFANTIALLLGYVALAVMYAFRTVFDVLFKGITLMGHALLAAVGFYRSIGTCICLVINMLAQLFICTIFYSFMVDLMFGISSIFDGILYNLFVGVFGNLGAKSTTPSGSFYGELLTTLSSAVCAFVIVFFVAFAIRWRSAIISSINSMVERLMSTLLGEQLSGASDGYMGGMAMAALNDATNIAKGAAIAGGAVGAIGEMNDAISDLTGMPADTDSTPSDVTGENKGQNNDLDEQAKQNEADRTEANEDVFGIPLLKGNTIDPYSGTTLTPEQAEAYRNMSPEEQAMVKGIASDEDRKAYLQDAVEKNTADEAETYGNAFGWSDEQKEAYKGLDSDEQEKVKSMSSKDQKEYLQDVADKNKAAENSASEEDLEDDNPTLPRLDSDEKPLTYNIASVKKGTPKKTYAPGADPDESDGSEETPPVDTDANTNQETAEVETSNVAAAGTENIGVVSDVTADENGDTVWMQTNPETGTKTGAKFDPTRGLVFATENADGTVSDVAIGLNGISVGSTDADGNNSVTTIGENGMTTNYTGADGTTETVDATFDGVNSGVRVTRTDADGNVETSVADINGVTTQKMEKTADGSTKVTTLNPNGTTTVEESNAATGYHSVEEIAADNSSVKTEQLGNTTISTATDANGNVTDQTIVGVDSTGQAYSQSYSVDENGDITESTSKNGVTLSEVTHADGSRDEIQRTVRSDGTIAEVKTSYEPGESEGVQTSRLLAADGTTVLQTGDVSTGSDENGEYTVTSYETAAGRFEAKEYTSGDMAGQKITTDYDKASGGLTTTVDDGTGNLTITTSNANNPDAGSIEYKVDKKGNVTYTTTTPDGNVIDGGELAADANGVVNIEKAGGSGVIAIGTVGSGGDKETVISQDYAAGGSSIVSTNIKSGNSTSTFTDAAGAETVQSYDAKTQAVNTTYTDIVGNYGHSEQLADGTFNDSVQIAGGGSRTVQRVVSGDNIIETASTVGLAGNTQTITSTNGDVTKIEAQSASGSYVQERDSDGVIHISQVTAGGDKITKTVQTNGDYLADTVYSNGSTSHVSSVGGEVTSYGTSVTGVETSSVQNGSNMSETVKYASMQTVNTLSQGSSTKTFVTSAGQAFTVVNDGDGDKTIMDMGNGNTASYKHNPDGSNTVIVHNANGSGLTEMIDANGNSQVIYTDTKGNVVQQPSGYDTINMQIAEAAKQAMPIAAATTAAFVVGQQTADFRTTAQAQDMYINSIYAGSAGTNLNLGAAPTGVVYNAGVNGVIPNGTAYVPGATGVLPNGNVQYVSVPGAVTEPIAPDVLAASVANTSNITTNTLKRSSTSTSMYEKLFNNLMNNNQTNSDTVINDETDDDGDTSDPKTTDTSRGQYGENKYDVTGSASDSSSNNNGK